MTSAEYWSLVTEKQAELKAAHQLRLKAYEAKGDAKHLEGQPVDGSAYYIISRRSVRLGTKAGVMSMAAPRLAAKALIDETHELATGPQISAYLEAQEKLAESNRQRDLRQNQKGGNVTNYYNSPPVVEKK